MRSVISSSSVNFFSKNLECIADLSLSTRSAEQINSSKDNCVYCGFKSPQWPQYALSIAYCMLAEALATHPDEICSATCRAIDLHEQLS